MRLGILHPGAMGATVAAAAVAESVVWASSGRSPATLERAAAAGCTDRVNVAGLVASSDLIISVCPPHAAADVARDVATAGFAGIYVDANAVAPATSRVVGKTVTAAGARFVDGGIVGPPAIRPGTTRLYLAGDAAPDVAFVFAGGPLEAIVLDGPPGTASSLKMAYAAYTKGTAALVAAIRALAAAEGIEAPLLAEWDRSVPGLAERSTRILEATPRKAWRFAGEMREIAATFDSADLPAGFHEAAAEIYDRLAEYKYDPSPDPHAVIESLLPQIGKERSE
jgi:3-hydroxyisobutyrate dehydrogenase-like beta-hydroxyacid dehydrogenase